MHTYIHVYIYTSYHDYTELLTRVEVVVPRCMCRTCSPHTSQTTWCIRTYFYYYSHAYILRYILHLANKHFHFPIHTLYLYSVHTYYTSIYTSTYVDTYMHTYIHTYMTFSLLLRRLGRFLTSNGEGNLLQRIID